MSTTVTECPAGHRIQSQSDRTAQGLCRACKREFDRFDRLKNRAALDVVRIFEAAGVQFQNAGVPVTAQDVAAQMVLVYGDEIGMRTAS